MNVSVEEKKKEAIERMKLLGIFPETIRQFKDEGKISQSLPPVGACYWIEGEQLERVREFEKENNALVYFVIHSYTNIGEMETYLYVSNFPGEWKRDRADIQGDKREEKVMRAYVYNISFPWCSDEGDVTVKLTPAAGLRRTY